MTETETYRKHINEAFVMSLDYRKHINKAFSLAVSNVITRYAIKKHIEQTALPATEVWTPYDNCILRETLDEMVEEETLTKVACHSFQLTSTMQTGNKKKGAGATAGATAGDIAGAGADGGKKKAAGADGGKKNFAGAAGDADGSGGKKKGGGGGGEKKRVRTKKEEEPKEADAGPKKSRKLTSNETAGSNKRPRYETRIVEALRVLGKKKGSPQSILAVRTYVKNDGEGKGWSDAFFIRSLETAVERGILVQDGLMFRRAIRDKRLAIESEPHIPTDRRLMFRRAIRNKRLAIESEPHIPTDPPSNPPPPGTGWTNGQVHPLHYPHTDPSGRVRLYTSSRRLIHTATSWSRTGDSCPNDPHAASSSGAALTSSPTEQDDAVRALICQLSERFQKAGWLPGTGGGMSVRVGEGSVDSPWRVFSTPSGLMKEDMIGDDIFQMDAEGAVTVAPRTVGLKASSMVSLWFIVYRLRPTVRCVIHTHSMNAQLASLLSSGDEGAESERTLTLTHLEMLKGVGNHAYDSTLEIPIIPNRSSEHLLGPDLERAIVEYPKCNAVLVRRHGVYVWGDTWEEAKVRLESFDYLFQTAREMRVLGVDCGKVPPPPQQQQGEKQSFLF